jgi:ssDNA thymidine ADP-ribosyltransferase DarT-like protein
MVAATNPLLRIPRLYHFTDIRNLPMIKALDGLHSTAKLNELGAEFHAGGDDRSLQLDIESGMDHYVHLCFDLRHPMECYVQARNPDAKLKYLRIDRAVLDQEGVRFATGVGYAHGVDIFPIADAKGKIDYEVLYNYMPWGDPAVQARRRAAELCEILVPDYVPLKLITNLPND